MNSKSKLDILVGQNMKRIRTEKLGISQEKMARDVNLSRSFISHVESPKIEAGVSLDTLYLIANYYGFDIREFFEGYEEMMEAEKR